MHSATAALFDVPTSASWLPGTVQSAPPSAGGAGGRDMQTTVSGATRRCQTFCARTSVDLIPAIASAARAPSLSPNGAGTLSTARMCGNRSEGVEMTKQSIATALLAAVLSVAAQTVTGTTAAADAGAVAAGGKDFLVVFLTRSRMDRRQAAR